MNTTTLPRIIAADRLNVLLSACRCIGVLASATWPHKEIAADIALNLQSCPLATEWRATVTIKLDSCLPGDFVSKLDQILTGSGFNYHTNGYNNVTVLYVYEPIPDEQRED